jgi:signal transduction histidine kinase
MADRRLPRRPEAWLRIGTVAAAVVLLVVSISVGAGLYDVTLIVLYIGVLAQVCALPLALVRPVLAAPLSVLASLLIVVSAVSDTAPWPWAVTSIITQSILLALLGYRAPWLLGAGTLVTVVALSGLAVWLVDPGHDQERVAANLVVFSSVGGAALVAGIVAREWEQIRRQLTRERRLTEDERALRLVAEEKTRIARELHDVIAHGMSIITVQATSAPFRLPQADADVRAEFEEIAATSRRALAEMRSLLGVLRDPDAPVTRTPQPRLSGITDLVARSIQSGLPVQLVGAEHLTDDGVDEAVGLTAYRIVQEALSNVIRHADGAEVEVRVQRGDELDLRVSNFIAEPSAAPGTGTGSGLLGMRERAASVGGTVIVGPTGDGRYEVHATLPLHGAGGDE